MSFLNVKDFLRENGYTVIEHSNYYQIPALWRGGSDPTSVVVYPSNNTVIDFVANEKFNIEELLCKVAGIASKFELRKFLDEKNIKIIKTSRSGVVMQIQKPFPLEVIKNLYPDYTYFIGRGIREETIKTFRGGVCGEGRLKNRFVFPVFNSKGQIIGLFGRAIDSHVLPKYKILGKKGMFVYPAFVNFKQISEAKEVILVESPVCVFKLWDCNIKNTLCLFGTEISNAILNFCIKINAKRIIISTNNEQSMIGNNASIKMADRLRRYFDHEQVLIHLPLKKDFGEMSCKEIEEWKSKI